MEKACHRRELTGLVNTWVSIEINSKNGWTALWNGRPPRSNARRPFLRQPADWRSFADLLWSGQNGREM